MALFGSADSSPSLLTSVRTLARVVVAMLYTRLDLVTTELGEEAFRIMYLVGAGIIGVLCLHGAFFFIMLWILAALWDTQYRLWVIGGIALLYLLIAGGALLFARHLILNRPRFLGQTLDELKKDVESLKGTPSSTEAHS